MAARGAGPLGLALLQVGLQLFLLGEALPTLMTSVPLPAVNLSQMPGPVPTSAEGLLADVAFEGHDWSVVDWFVVVDL